MLEISVHKISFLSTLFLIITLMSCKSPSTESTASSLSNDKTPFQLIISPPATGKIGDSLTMTFKVIPKGIYKINLEYPIRLDIQGPPAASPSKITIKKEGAATFTPKELIVKPTFRVNSLGKHQFKGIFKFSVCTEEQCEIKSEKVQWVSVVELTNLPPSRMPWNI